MSTSAPQPGNPPAATPAPYSRPPQDPQNREIRVVSHCTLFYWWPVWAVGFIMFLITAIAGEYMVTVPPHTSAIKGAHKDEKGKVHDAFVLPEGKSLEIDKDHPENPKQPSL